MNYTKSVCGQNGTKRAENGRKKNENARKCLKNTSKNIPRVCTVCPHVHINSSKVLQRTSSAVAAAILAAARGNKSRQMPIEDGLRGIKGTSGAMTRQQPYSVGIP